MERRETDGPDAAGTAQFVEDLGLYFEAYGLTRMAGRMLGHLLVCDPDHQSADQLMDALRASSGGVSTTARSLIQMGLVERVAVPHDRRAFYRLRPHAWTAIFREREEAIRRLRLIAEEGLEALAQVPEARRRRLTEMRDLFVHIEHEWPALLARYDHRSGTRQEIRHD